MLRSQLLVDLELFLRFVLLPGVHVRLTQPIVRIGNTGIDLQGLTYSGIASA